MSRYLIAQIDGNCIEIMMKKDLNKDLPERRFNFFKKLTPKEIQLVSMALQEDGKDKMEEIKK